jgi:hypothetical protein
MTSPCRLILIDAPPRSGGGLAAQMLAAHPAALLLDHPDCADWLKARAAGEAEADALYDFLLRDARSLLSAPGSRFEAGEEDAPPRLKPSVRALILRAPGLAALRDQARAVDPDALLLLVRRDPRGRMASLRKMGWTDEAIRPELAAYRPQEERELRRDPLTLAISFEHLISSPRRAGAQMRAFVGLEDQTVGGKSGYKGFFPDGITRRSTPISTDPLTAWRDWLSPREAEKALKAARWKQLDPACEAPPPALAESADKPIILTGRGGGGTRLIGEMAKAAGVSLGARLNASADSLDYVELIYALALRRLEGAEDHPGAAAALRDQAAKTLSRTRPGALGWGWKLPETLLILHDLISAFPRARIVNLMRHPVGACLRRSHVTSRPDHAIGRAVLAAGYAEIGRSDADLAAEPEHVRNAVSWRFQMRRLLDFNQAHDRPGRQLDLRYEDLVRAPAHAADRLAAFLGAPPGLVQPPQIDRDRLTAIDPEDPRIAEVWEICGETAEALGYSRDAF